MGIASLLFVAALSTMSVNRYPNDQYPVIRPPEFVGGEADWLNTKPLSIKDLKGKVVLVDFWEYTCVNCIRTFPYMNEWWNRYKDKGLVIVGIHTPEFKFAADRENVAAAVKRFGLQFPILIDSKVANWDNYLNNYWPMKYLIDKDGKIVYEHAGEGNYGATELAIQKLLKEANPKVELPKIMDSVRDTDKPGAVCYPTTQELYAGLRGFDNGQYGITEFRPGITLDYPAPNDIQEGLMYLTGTWRAEEDHIESRGDHSTLELQYKAKEANAVLKPTSGTVRMEVFQDGLPIAKEDAGPDVKFEDGRAIVTVSDARMYALVVNRKWGHHRLSLRPLGPGVGVYSFTFSTSCE